MPQDKQPSLPEDAELVAGLDAKQFERLLRLRALELGEPPPPPPSRFGRVAHAATNERRLVLFTLGIVVLVLIVSLFILVAWFEPGETTVSGLTTLAGTGLGFIGGMVSREKAGEKEPTKPTGRRTPPVGGGTAGTDETQGGQVH
jgi:hypothetical protein